MEKRYFRKSSVPIFITIFFTLLIFQTVASKLAARIAESLNYRSIDIYNVYACISVHHILQMLFALIVIFILFKKYHLQFNLRFQYSSIGIRYTIIFTIVIFIVVFLDYFIVYKFGMTSFYSYPINTRNVIGCLGFQLLLSGPSEEILFRALPLTLLIYVQNNEKKDRNTLVPILCTSLLFSIAHINWSISPFQISFDNWFQLIYSFLLGIAYSITYIKSKSVWYPMIMHSLSNILMVGGGYLFTILIIS